MKLRCGTRASTLAMVQTELFLKKLTTKEKGLQIEVVPIKTTPDKKQEIPLHEFGGRGLFVREIEDKVLENEIDFIVHSLKDLPTALHPELELACVPMRGPHQDIVYSTKYRGLKDLPSGSRIGTGSFRRRAQILRIRKDLEIANIRGNVDTRIEKVHRGQYDAIIIAEAGVQRLNRFNKNCQRLKLEEFLPAVGQGALGIECRKDNLPLRALLSQVEDSKTREATMNERSLAQTIGAGCQTPLAAFAESNGNELHLRAELYSTDGEICLRESGTGPSSEAQKLGEHLGRQLRQQAEQYSLEQFILPTLDKR